jgi:hypothetical protein
MDVRLFFTYSVPRAYFLTTMSVCDDVVGRLETVVLSVEARMNERLDDVEARIERLREAVVSLQRQGQPAAKGKSRGAGATSRGKRPLPGGTIAQTEARERTELRLLLSETPRDGRTLDVSKAVEYRCSLCRSACLTRSQGLVMRAIKHVCESPTYLPESGVPDYNWNSERAFENAFHAVLKRRLDEHCQEHPRSVLHDVLVAYPQYVFALR